MIEQPSAPVPGEHLTVLVPCLNEELTIEKTVRDILTVLPRLPMPAHVLMIDDGSRDKTRAKMESLCSQFEACRMTVNPRNLGVGRSIMNAYEHIESGTWVTGMPGDNELIFESILEFMPIRHQFDVILGYLHNPVIRPFLRRIASFCYSKTVATLYGFPYRYLNGMKLYKVDAFRGIEVLSGGHAFNAELLAKALLRNPSLRIGEAGFRARGRSAGSSKAIRPQSIVRAMYEVSLGFESVTRYRDVIIRERYQD